MSCRLSRSIFLSLFFVLGCGRFNKEGSSPRRYVNRPLDDQFIVGPRQRQRRVESFVF
jgi:hypothetical protein